MLIPPLLLLGTNQVTLIFLEYIYSIVATKCVCVCFLKSTLKLYNSQGPQKQTNKNKPRKQKQALFLIKGIVLLWWLAATSACGIPVTHQHFPFSYGILLLLKLSVAMVVTVGQRQHIHHHAYRSRFSCRSNITIQVFFLIQKKCGTFWEFSLGHCWPYMTSCTQRYFGNAKSKSLSCNKWK